MRETKPWTICGAPSTVQAVAKFCGIAESTCWYHAKRQETYEGSEIKVNIRPRGRKKKTEVGNPEYAALSDKPRYSTKTPSKWEMENLTVREHRWIPYDKTLCR